MNFFRCGYLCFHGTVRLLFVTDMHNAVWRGETSLGPLQAAEMRTDTDRLTAAFQNGDAENGFHDKWNRSGSPAMTQAVAQSGIAIGAEIPVDVRLIL